MYPTEIEGFINDGCSIFNDEKKRNDEKNLHGIFNCHIKRWLTYSMYYWGYFTTG
jgi:hypothetical protein